MSIYWIPAFIKDGEVTETGKSVITGEAFCQQHGMIEGFKFHWENRKKWRKYQHEVRSIWGAFHSTQKRQSGNSGFWEEDRAAEYTSLIQSSRGRQSGQALSYRVVNGKACVSRSILQPDGSTSAHSLISYINLILIISLTCQIHTW